jgi:hypothetical protein
MDLRWYWKRLSLMDAAEIVGRVREAILRLMWRTQRATHNVSNPVDFLHASCRIDFPRYSPAPTALAKPAVDRLQSIAEDILKGQWFVFGHVHPKFDQDPDWFVDAKSGQRLPADDYTFDIRYRDDQTRDIKSIWEPSRHHHLTILAAAYFVTRDERYATRIATHLRSWWRENPFLTGPHWNSGIEIALRLLSWAWIRRLLMKWPEARDLFENNPEFVEQLYWHQRWLAAFSSHGSSANNHLIAEAAGQFVASCAFPWFKDSTEWRQKSAAVLRTESKSQTFASGLNRELATDYHGFVLEMLLTAAITGELHGYSLSSDVWERIRAMIDALASIMDATGRPPRQGDGDDGTALLLDAPDYDRWNALLATGRRLFGAAPWWPAIRFEDVRTGLWTAGVSVPSLPSERSTKRLDYFADAGQVYLRSGQDTKEIWCRCDHGPHGFLSIAAHAHADALAIEVRVAGVDILTDPGTYCYHGEPRWRAYFRSSLAHNTLEILAQDQSISGGPFLWTKHAVSKLLMVDGLEEDAPRAVWRAEHDGYVSRGGPVHRRTVTLDRRERVLTIDDEIRPSRLGSTPVRFAFHLGPTVDCKLASFGARLSWPHGTAQLELPETLTWSFHRGEIDPPMGWYSLSFGVKRPSFTLLGHGNVNPCTPLQTRLRIC